MQPPKQYTAKLEDTTVFNPKYTQYEFELVEPYDMPFQAGQYVSLKVAENGTRRAYSICSTPGISHGFELLVDLEPQGVGATFLQQLEFGQEVQVLGPLGQFVLAPDLGEGHPDREEALVFVATGSGVAPFRSMLFELLQEQQDTRPVILHWGMRHLEQLFWEDEFAELMQSFPNFHFHPVISQPIAGWNLCSGHVTDCLSVHEQPERAGYYLCGNAPMISEVMELLGKQGVAPERIHHEKFY
jgi:Na+-transporting NADH:ubiquinone oxidoreductase subunit F